MKSDSKPTSYRNPPEHTRFKPGHSGNPLGRPKKRKSVADELAQELSQIIRVREGTRMIEMTKARAIAKELTRLAMDGDLRAATIVVSYSGRSSDDDDSNNETTPDDVALVDSFVEREIRRRAADLKPNQQNSENKS
jgi:Family of unknown function (DUF5681)